MKEEIREHGNGWLEASQRTPTGWRTCVMTAETRAIARQILGRDFATVAEVFAAQEAIEAHARDVLARSRRRWIAWLERFGDETGAELAARVKRNEVL